MDRVIAAGWKSVEKTPSLLRVLADAGVVDAGGYGLVVLIEGAANGLGRVGGAHRHACARRAPTLRRAARRPRGRGGERVHLLLQLPAHWGGSRRQLALESEFGALGDSLLVVGGEGQFKVHVHTDEPGQGAWLWRQPRESSARSRSTT